jgi:hypothetical protein
MTLNLMTFSKIVQNVALGITVKNCKLLFVTILWQYAECHYVECRYA